MEFKDLASLIAVKEGKKSQTHIGDVREVLSVLSEIMVENEEVVKMLLENGKKRIKKSKK